MVRVFTASCQYERCPNQAIGEDIGCGTCRRWLCREHYDSEEHVCRYTEPQPLIDAFRTSLEDLDIPALQQLAESLRPDHTCRIQDWHGDVYELWFAQGAFSNMHLDIIYDDGVRWMIRFPAYELSRPMRPQDSRQIRRSEVATHNALALTGIPVPAVHHWGQGELSKTNDQRCVCMIFDRLPGADVGEAAQDFEVQTRQQMIEQYADIAIKISSVQFGAIGSLDFDSDGKITVGPCMDCVMPLHPDLPAFDGPYQTLRERHLSKIDRVLALIVQGALHRRGPLLAYLAYLEIRRLVEACEELAREATACFIEHPDSHPGNLLMKGSTITGYIDWEWTCVTPKEAAFAAPRWMHETEAYEAGDNKLSDEEEYLCSVFETRHRPDLAECVRAGRVHQRLRDAINGFFLQYGEQDILGHLNGLANAVLGDQAGEPATSVTQWRLTAMDRFRCDAKLADVVALDATLETLRKPVTVAVDP